MLNWMKRPLYRILALPFLLGINSFISADDCTDLCECYRVTIGPEYYHFNREREGGTTQSGNIWGGRLELERLKPWGVYVGFSGLYAKGYLEGSSFNSRTEEKNHLKSHVTDEDIEGRLGYTFQTNSEKAFAFTPFLGGGYFRESHRYVSPSPLTIHFCNTFPYVSAGFLAKMDLSSSWDIGLNFKVRYMVDPKNKITNDPDPEVDDITIAIDNRFHYRVELPLSYYFGCDNDFQLSFVPFYEFRHYGGHPNFPFDFLETKINLYGARATIAYWF